MATVNSSTDICNLALDLLSADRVNDIEGAAPTASEEILARWYDQARKKALREHPWNFAVKRAILSSDSTTPAYGYNKQFSMPSDFIRLSGVYDNEGYTISNTLYAFEGNKILANVDGTALRIRYIYDYTDVSSMDALFIDFLALEIAISVAYKFTNSNSNIQRLGELHKMRGALARAIDGQESPPKRIERSRSVNARRFGSSSQAHRIIF